MMDVYRVKYELQYCGVDSGETLWEKGKELHVLSGVDARLAIDKAAQAAMKSEPLTFRKGEGREEARPTVFRCVAVERICSIDVG
jgi:hypothetical protein